MYIEQKQTAFKQTIPILAEGLEQGTYIAKVEGLGEESSKEIEIESTTTEIQKETEPKTITENKAAQQTKLIETKQTLESDKTKNTTASGQAIIKQETTQLSWIESNKEKLIFLSILALLTILIVSKDIRSFLINKTKRFNNAQRKLTSWTEKR